jgi:hypothetical protein
MDRLKDALKIHLHVQFLQKKFALEAYPGPYKCTGMHKSKMHFHGPKYPHLQSRAWGHFFKFFIASEMAQQASVFVTEKPFHTIVVQHSSLLGPFLSYECEYSPIFSYMR